MDLSIPQNVLYSQKWLFRFFLNVLHTKKKKIHSLKKKFAFMGLCLFRRRGRLFRNCSVHMDYFYNVFLKSQDFGVTDFQWSVINLSGFIKNIFTLFSKIIKSLTVTQDSFHF